MFDFNAYCFCPDLIADKIGDANFFINLICPTTVNSNHHVVIDSKELLWLEYMERNQGCKTSFENLLVWRKFLDSKSNKIIKSESVSDGGTRSLVVDTIINAPTTCRKYLVSLKNDEYNSFIGKLTLNSVDLLSEFNLSDSTEANGNRKLRYNLSVFQSDFLKALEIVSQTRVGKKEDEHNDYVRDLLDFKGYDIYDQTRRGKSFSELNLGELDLAIKYDNRWVAIIEALRLKSVDKSNIIKHYKKLLINYNPLQLTNTFLVVYYIGSDNGFLNFFTDYKRYISTLVGGDVCSKSDLEFVDLFNCKSDYASIKSFVHRVKIDGNILFCQHICVKFC